MNSTTLQSWLEEDLSHVVNRKDHWSQRDQVKLDDCRPEPQLSEALKGFRYLYNFWFTFNVIFI